MQNCEIQALKRKKFIYFDVYIKERHAKNSLESIYFISYFLSQATLRNTLQLCEPLFLHHLGVIVLGVRFTFSIYPFLFRRIHNVITKKTNFFFNSDQQEQKFESMGPVKNLTSGFN